MSNDGFGAHDDHDAIPVLTEILGTAAPRDMHDKVLASVLPRAQTLVAQQMDQVVASVIARSTEALALELRDAIEHAVQDIVSRLVTEEVSRLQAQFEQRHALD
jgi:hypothetical protein